LVIKDAGAQAGAAAARRSAPPVSGRRVWLAAFAAVAALLLARSPFLFTTRLYETADEAANSILVLQAMHFTLLHGNYSLEGFFHPGPAYLYVMAAGQWLFRDVLHLVPTPWNGQLIAILLLNSAEVATVAWIVYRWAGSAWAAAVAVALIIGLAAAVDVGVPAVINRDILGANWMPDMYVPTFLAFVAAAASVAAGRTSHLGLLAATGWLATHGHAEFLFFVPRTGTRRGPRYAGSFAAGGLITCRPWPSARSSRCRSRLTSSCTGRGSSVCTGATPARAGRATTRWAR
jgi:hypothetical protein